MTATEIVLISSDDEEPATESANAIIIQTDSEEEDSSEDSGEDSGEDELGKRSRSSSYHGSVYANSLERQYNDDLSGRNDEYEWWTGTVEDGYPGEDNWT